MVKIPSLKESNRYDFRSGIGVGAPPGKASAQNWSFIGKIIGDISDKLGSAYLQQKRETRKIRYQTHNQNYVRGLESGVLTHLENPANQLPGVDVVQIVQDYTDKYGEAQREIRAKDGDHDEDEFQEAYGTTIKTENEVNLQRAMRLYAKQNVGHNFSQKAELTREQLTDLVGKLDFSDTENLSKNIERIRLAADLGHDELWIMKEALRKGISTDEYIKEEAAGGETSLIRHARDTPEAILFFRKQNAFIGTALTKRLKSTWDNWLSKTGNKIEMYTNGKVKPKFMTDALKMLKGNPDFRVNMLALETELNKEVLPNLKNKEAFEKIEKTNNAEAAMEEYITKKNTLYELHAKEGLKGLSTTVGSGDIWLEGYEDEYRRDFGERLSERGLYDKLKKEHVKTASEHGFSPLRLAKTRPTYAQENESYSAGLGFENTLADHIENGTLDSKILKSLRDDVAKDKTLLFRDSKRLLNHLARMTGTKLRRDKVEAFGQLYKFAQASQKEVASILASGPGSAARLKRRRKQMGLSADIFNQLLNDMTNKEVSSAKMMEKIKTMINEAALIDRQKVDESLLQLNDKIMGVPGILKLSPSTGPKEASLYREKLLQLQPVIKDKMKEILESPGVMKSLFKALAVERPLTGMRSWKKPDKEAQQVVIDALQSLSDNISTYLVKDNYARSIKVDDKEGFAGKVAGLTSTVTGNLEGTKLIKRKTNFTGGSDYFDQQ